MLLDLGVIALVAIMAIAGGISGALAQLVRLLALALAALLAAPAAAFLTPLIGGWLSLPPKLLAVLSVAVSFVALLLLLRWAGLSIARRIAGGGELRAVDRGGGALLGAAKALLIGWLIASAWVSVEDLVGRRWGSEASFAAAGARSHNLFRLGSER